MSTFEEQSVLLDQLQAEVNRVLEQTGRLFAAANSGSRSAPAAQALKLKKELPGSISRFHETLDQLEDELQLARAVMRRDLAVCRIRDGPSPTTSVAPIAPANEISEMEVDMATDVDVVVKSDVDAPEVIKPTVSSPGLPVVSPSRSDSDDVKVQPTKDSDQQHSAEALSVEHSPEPVEQDAKSTQYAVDSIPATAPEDDDSKTSEPALQVDTKLDARSYLRLDGNSAHQDDEAPDTGTFSNAADLDSLFNDPTSAVDAVNTAAPPSFDMDVDTAASFDFDSFNTNIDTTATDNDNISALLPGLEDYANTQPVGSTESFNALFATDVPVDGSGADGGNLQGTGEHDSTFDDLMDFDEFNADDYAGGGENGTGGDQIFDFAFE